MKLLAPGFEPFGRVRRRVDADRDQADVGCSFLAQLFLHAGESGAERWTDRRARREDEIDDDCVTLDEVRVEMNLSSVLIEQFDVRNVHPGTRCFHLVRHFANFRGLFTFCNRTQIHAALRTLTLRFLLHIRVHGTRIGFFSLNRVMSHMLLRLHRTECERDEHHTDKRCNLQFHNQFFPCNVSIGSCRNETPCDLLSTNTKYEPVCGTFMSSS